MSDFFNKAGPSDAKKKAAAPVPRKISQKMKPASPPKPKKAAAPKKKVVDSDDDDDDDIMDYDELPKAPAPARARAARTAPKKYVEVISDDEPADAEDSLFEDDD